eukprot:80695_1
MRFLLLITLFSWFQLIDAYRTMCRRKRYQLSGATLRASSMYRPRVLSSQFWKNRCLVISVLVGALLFLSVTLGYVCTRKDTAVRIRHDAASDTRAASTDSDGIMRRPDLVEPSELADSTVQLPADGTVQLPADGTTELPADGTTQLPADGIMQRTDHVEQSDPAKRVELSSSGGVEQSVEEKKIVFSASTDADGPMRLPADMEQSLTGDVEKDVEEEKSALVVFDRKGYRKEIGKANAHSPPLPTYSPEHFEQIVEILMPKTSNQKQFKKLLKDLGVDISGGAIRKFLDPKGANWKLVNGKFFETTLPFIKDLVIRTHEIFPDANTIQTLGPLSTYNSEKTVELSRRQCACLHANGFFRLLREVKDTIYPKESNFGMLLSGWANRGLQSAQYFTAAVLYFQKLASRKKDDAVLDQKVRFTRRSITDTEFGNVMASNAKKPLSEVFMHKNSEVIEDAPDGVLRVDFADRYPGGGFYHGLRTQEEALFAQHPEAAISMYISASLEDNEVILIRGARRFSKLGVYSGDSRVYDHKKTFDEHEQTIAVMDALDLKTNLELFPEDYQYTVKGKRRELLKAFLGFSYEKFGDSGVATGQWGGAEFGGDSKLKALLQLRAASYAGKTMHYYPFDGKGPKDVGAIRDLMDKKGWRAGDLWNWLKKSKDLSTIFAKLRKTLESSN